MIAPKLPLEIVIENRLPRAATDRKRSLLLMGSLPSMMAL